MTFWELGFLKKMKKEKIWADNGWGFIPDISKQFLVDFSRFF